MRPLKTCPGEHRAEEPCAVCVEDDKLCDLCWETEDPLNVREVAVPERWIEVESGLRWDRKYVVCSDHYNEHQRRVELELI